MQKFDYILYVWLSVLATLLCSIYLILDVAMTLDVNGLWEFYSFYGSSAVPFYISAYIGCYILICMFSLIITFCRFLVNHIRRIDISVSMYSPLTLCLRKIAISLSFWVVSVNLVLLVMCFPGIKNT